MEKQAAPEPLQGGENTSFREYPVQTNVCHIVTTKSVTDRGEYF